MKKELWVTSFLLCAGIYFASAEKMTINEVMQSNINGLYVDNEFPDSWI